MRISEYWYIINAGCQDECINTMGGKECGCSDGFQLGDDQTSCVLKGKLKSKEQHFIWISNENLCKLERRRKYKLCEFIATTLWSCSSFNFTENWERK